MRSMALLLHDHMKVEDVPVGITYVESAMPPGLGRQLLDPLNLEAFESRVLPVHIRDFQLNQDTVIRRTSQSTESEHRTLRLAPQGEGASLQGKFDIVRACRVMEVGGLGQRFQPKEHQVLILG
jgi:hypothetical protein